MLAKMCACNPKSLEKPLELKIRTTSDLESGDAQAAEHQKKYISRASRQELAIQIKDFTHLHFFIVTMALTDLIQSIISAVGNLAPFHLLSFSALLGTELYQTFIVTKVTFNELPRTAFTTLQKRLFPIYFQGQTLLLFLSAVTFPPHGPFSLVQHKGDWIPFAVAGVTSALNLILYGPRTRQTMIDRIHQGTNELASSL